MNKKSVQLALVLSLCETAQAVTNIWDGGGNDLNWMTASNWVGDAAPIPSTGTTLFFSDTTGANSTNNFPDGTQFQAIKFASGAVNYVLNGNRVALGDAGGSSTIFDTATGASNLTVNLDISINEGIGSFVLRSGGTLNGVLTNFYASPNANQTVGFSSGRIYLNNTNNSFAQGVDISGGGTAVVSQWINSGLRSQLGSGYFIKLGNAGAAGTIEYTGPVTSSDRQILMGDNNTNNTFTGSGTIKNNGTGALVFTRPQFTSPSNTLTRSARSLTLGGTFTGGVNVVQGIIADNNTNATISLIKTEASIWRLDGTNTYTGTTAINGGTLTINGNHSAATGAVTVASGATLAGSGIIGGAVTVNGTHSPGNGPGVQTINGNLTYGSGSAIYWELTNNSASAGFDQVIAGGNLDFTGSAKLKLEFAASGSAVNWSDSFWDSARSWLIADVSGVSTNVSRLFVIVENWADAQGDRMDDVRPRSFFSIRQSGSDVYLDYTPVSLPTGSALIERSGGKLLQAGTTNVFSPIGFNFIRLRSDGTLHQTFAPYRYDDGTNVVETYNGLAATEMFRKLASAGFNTVRVFINQAVTDPLAIVSGSTSTVGLSPAYMNNVVDFLQRARAENVFVMPSLGFFPLTDYYKTLMPGPIPTNVNGNNLYYFDPQYIAAKKLYIKDFFNAILARDPDAIRAILALDLGNELNYPVTSMPFSLSSGSVTGPNGVTYDIATQKTQMADEVAVYWINEIDSYIKKLIPGMMTDVNVFTYLAVSRSLGDFTTFNVDWKDRYSFRPRATAQSSADIVDIHMYPDSLAAIDDHLDSIEWSTLKPEAEAAGKVLMVGEFGVNYSNFGEGVFDTAKLYAPSFARYFNKLGFAGWLLWTYDCFEQNKHYPAAQNNFTIFNYLADEIPQARQTLYSESFDGTSFPPGWSQTTPASWSVSNGAANCLTSNTLQQIYRNGSTNRYSDFQITARLKFSSGTGWGGLNFRMTEANKAAWNSGYNLFMDKNGKFTLNVQPADGGTDIKLGEYVSGLNPFADWFELTVDAVGSRIKIWVNGTLAIDVTDETYCSGYFSLNFYQMTGSADSMTVYDAPAEQQYLLYDHFDGTAFNTDWQQTSQAVWSVSNSAAVCSVTNAGLQQIFRFGNTNLFTDFRITTRLKFDAGTSWGGIAFCKQYPDTAAWGTGYNLVLNSTGGLNLNVMPTDGSASFTLASFASGVAPFADWVELVVEAVDSRIKVWINGVLGINLTDRTWPSGYISLNLNGQAGRFDLISISSAGGLPHERFSVIPWNLTASSADTNSAAFETYALTRNLDFGNIRFLSPCFTNGVDWSDSFWAADHSWPVIQTTGAISNFSSLRIVQQDWPDAQGDLFSSVRPGRFFQLRQSGSTIWLDLTTPATREIHVAKTGSDSNDGSSGSPYLTINKAALEALPGDTVTIHAGTYREHVKPLRGGGAGCRITYRAAPGERVEIKGSNQYTDWTVHSGNIWKRVFTADEFNGYNPYTLEMTDAFLWGIHRKRGEVFFNGTALNEKTDLSQVVSSSSSWVSTNGLTVYANFGGANPNTGLAEIVLREQVFAPTNWNLGFITVRGLIIEHSANNVGDASGAAIGALSPRGGHDWIFENNFIKNTKSFGFGGGLEGPVPSINYAGWGIVPDRYAHHLIRNNVFKDIGTGGMHSYKGPFCTVESNAFIRCNRIDSDGAEKAGIKFVWHGNDVVIRNNYFYKNNTGNGFCAIWLDAGCQGAEVYNNAFVDNDYVWFEANLGPITFANNVMLNTRLRASDGGGVLMAHNLLVRMDTEDPNNSYTGGNDLTRFATLTYRSGTAFFEPHTLEQIGAAPLTARSDLHWHNNIISGNHKINLPSNDGNTFDNFSDYNVLLDSAIKSTQDLHSMSSAYDPGFSYTADDNGASIAFTMNSTPFSLNAPFMNHAWLGDLNRHVSHPIDAVNADYFSNAMNTNSPLPGPFAHLRQGANAFVLFRTPQEPGSLTMDSDGDGKSDVEEFAAGRNPATAADFAFEFNTNGSFEGWTSSGVNNAAVTNGLFSGTSASATGHVARSTLYMDAGQIKNLIIRLRSPVADGLTLEWAHAQDNLFSADRRIQAAYVSNDFRSVVIPLQGFPQWEGQTITGLRIVPVNTAASFDLDWVRASSGDLDGDQLPDTTEFADGYDAANAADALIDADSDGQNRLAEFVWGTSDSSAASRFTALLRPNTSTVSWNGVAGRSYQTWRRYSLLAGTWELIQTVGPLASNTAVTVTDSSAVQTNAAFYKITGAVILSP